MTFEGFAIHDLDYVSVVGHLLEWDLIKMRTLCLHDVDMCGEKNMPHVPVKLSSGKWPALLDSWI